MFAVGDRRLSDMPEHARAAQPEGQLYFRMRVRDQVVAQFQHDGAAERAEDAGADVVRKEQRRMAPTLMAVLWPGSGGVFELTYCPPTCGSLTKRPDRRTGRLSEILREDSCGSSAFATHKEAPSAAALTSRAVASASTG